MNGNLMSSDEHVRFLTHVSDLEEWNEDAGFEWDDDPRVHRLSNDVVSVVHLFTRPVSENEPELKMQCSAFALYTPEGDRLGLFISDPARPQDLATNMWHSPNVLVDRG